MRKVAVALMLLLAIGGAVWYFRERGVSPLTLAPSPTATPSIDLSIAAERERGYPGSELTLEQKLPDAASYTQSIVSYRSDGLKIYAMLTVPKGRKPEGGWPAIVFNHGYIAPEAYTTTGRYVQYVADLTKAGFIVLKPDYRGNGESEGRPDGAYFSSAYVTDDLNALASLRRYPLVNSARMGMWGHSMGGNVTLRAMVVDTTDIKAAVIWSGVVADYANIMDHWQNQPGITYRPSPSEMYQRYMYRQRIVGVYGTPESNPSFWNSIDPTSYLTDVRTPVQLHTTEHDNEVPPTFSQYLYNKLQALGKPAELYTYPGTDHNIASPNYETAMGRTIDFFNKYLK